MNVSFDALACLLAFSVVCLSDMYAILCSQPYAFAPIGENIGIQRIERDTYIHTVRDATCKAVCGWLCHMKVQNKKLQT